MRYLRFRLTRCLAVMAAVLLSAALPAGAANISKAYEFGPGLTYGTSVVRTFAIPSNRQVTAVVKYQRLSGTGQQDVPIVIELHEPDTDAGAEGPLVEARQVLAKTTEQSVTIQSLPSNHGGSGSSTAARDPPP
jgi:hypothetical protein